MQSTLPADADTVRGKNSVWDLPLSPQRAKPPAQRQWSPSLTDAQGAADTCGSLRKGFLLKAVLTPPFLTGSRARASVK